MFHTNAYSEVEVSQQPATPPHLSRAETDLSRTNSWGESPLERGPPGMRSITRKAWSALSVEISELDVRSPFESEYTALHARFTAVLDEVGGRMRTGVSRESLGGLAPGVDNAMLFAPSGATIHMASDGVCYVRSLVVHFDDRALARLFQAESLPALPLTARVNFFDQRLLGLARLFEAECMAGGPADVLYGDSLSISLVSLLARAHGQAAPRQQSGGLTPHQLRLVTGYMEAHFSETVSLPVLADLARLSPSHFCRVFKATTGTPPHRWLNDLRIAKAKSFLLDGHTLAEVAVATGFSDQPHLTRVFMHLTGTTPGAWRRQRAG